MKEQAILMTKFGGNRILFDHLTPNDPWMTFSDP